MIEISHVVVPKDEVLEFTIEGMRNPLNSWDKSDSAYAMVDGVRGYVIGDNDHNLMFMQELQHLYIGGKNLILTK